MSRGIAVEGVDARGPGPDRARRARVDGVTPTFLREVDDREAAAAPGDGPDQASAPDLLR
jgi:hypothetical protein